MRRALMLLSMPAIAVLLAAPASRFISLAAITPAVSDFQFIVAGVTPWIEPTIGDVRGTRECVQGKSWQYVSATSAASGFIGGQRKRIILSIRFPGDALRRRG